VRFRLPDEVRQQLLSQVLVSAPTEFGATQDDLDSDGMPTAFICLCERLAGKVEWMRSVQVTTGSADELLMGAESRRGKAILSAERAVATWYRAVQRLGKISADEGGAFATELPALKRNASKAVRIVGKLRARMPRQGQMPDPINEELTKGSREILARFGIHARPASVDGSRQGASPLSTLREILWNAIPNTGDLPDQRPYAGNSKDAQDALDGRAPPRVYIHPDEPKPVPNPHLRD
jgi:hypothetical protein